MPWDHKEFFEAIEDAPMTALWAFGGGVSCSLALALLLSSLPEPSAATKAILWALLALILALTLFNYKRTRARGLQRAEEIKIAFVTEAQAAAHAKIRASVDWIDVSSVISAQWNRVHGFVEVKLRVLSPALEPIELRSVDVTSGEPTSYQVTPICLQVILPGLSNFVIPLQTGETALFVGGNKGRDLNLTFRYAGSLPSLGLTADTRATTAQFEMHTKPRISFQAMISIEGEP